MSEANDDQAITQGDCVAGSAAQVANEGRTLTVPSEEYPTIASAIKSLQQGDVIFLVGQRYYENIVIKNCRFPVVIEGVSSGHTVLAMTYNESFVKEEYSSVLIEDSEGITLRNLQIECSPKFGNAVFAYACRHILIDRCALTREKGVSIESKQIHWKVERSPCPVDLTILNSTLCCSVSVEGEQTNVALVNCHFNYRGGKYDSAISVGNGGKLLMNSCLVEGYQSSGVWIDSPEAELINCVFDYNMGDGVSLGGKCRCAMTGCTVMNNGEWGVSVRNEAALILGDGNWIKGNVKGATENRPSEFSKRY